VDSNDINDIDRILSSNALNGLLVRYVMLYEATPLRLAQQQLAAQHDVDYHEHEPPEVSWIQQALQEEQQQVNDKTYQKMTNLLVEM
jgi:hypothetical protein